VRRRQKGGGLSPAAMGERIRPHGMGSVTTGGGRHRHTLYYEHSHHLVTSPVAGRGGTGHRLPRSKPGLGRGLWAQPSNRFFQYSSSTQSCKFKSSTFSMSKIIQTLHEARFKYFEQFSQMGQLRIPNRISDIKFGTDSSLNFL
jgi:hypothetical protein